jgi:hypothetical protein
MNFSTNIYIFRLDLVDDMSLPAFAATAAFAATEEISRKKKNISITSRFKIY